MTNQVNKASFLQICISVLAAMFGVQSEQSRARDFTQGNPWPYIAIGVLFIIIFVIVISLVVRLMMHIAS